MTAQSKSGNGSHRGNGRDTHAGAKSPDAIALLKNDHAKVKKMFSEFSKLEGREEKKRLAAAICTDLTVHTMIEEEILYPAAREALADDALLDEAEVEHASAKDLIAQIQDGSPDDEKWEAKVIVLGEYITHHVEEEHKEMFPKIRKSKLDLHRLGMALQLRKDQLTASRSLRGQPEHSRSTAT